MSEQEPSTCDKVLDAVAEEAQKLCNEVNRMRRAADEFGVSEAMQAEFASKLIAAAVLSLATHRYALGAFWVRKK